MRTTSKWSAKCALVLAVGAYFAAYGPPAIAEPIAQQIEQRSTIGFDSTYQVGDQQGFGVSDGGFAPVSYAVRESTAAGGAGSRSLGTTWGGAEFKARYEHQWVFPAFRWSKSALAAENNITVGAVTGVSPISATQELRVTATPVAFLQAHGGASIGSGWNLQVFDGLGAVDPETGEVESTSFSGAVIRAFLGGTFQFDLAAVLPGAWNHVVTVVSPQFVYSTLSSANATTAWSFENDEGANYNGWTRRLTAVLGHQPPLPTVETIGVLYESEQLVGSALERARKSATEAFDPGFRTDRWGLLVNLVLGADRSHSITVIPQIQRNRLASEETVFNAGVQRRETVGSYWDFYRVVVQYRFRL